MAASEKYTPLELKPQGTPVGFFSVLTSLASKLSLGTDITRIPLPSIFCYPISLLEIIAVKRMRGMDICEQIAAEENKYTRMLLIVKWIFSAITPDQFGKKPMNPISGETFECRTDTSYYFAEQVKHHPPISAFHFEHEPSGCVFHGHTQVVARLGGNSVAATFEGKAYFHVPKYDEVYEFSMPMPIIHACNLVIGSSHNELGGDIDITCEQSQQKMRISFHTTGMFTGTMDRVSGLITSLDSKGKKKDAAVTFQGLWSGQVKASAAKGNEEAQAAVEQFEDGLVFDYEESEGVECEILVREGAWDSRSIWGETMDCVRANDLNAGDEANAKVEKAQRERFLEAGDKENGGYVAKYFEEFGEGSYALKDGHVKTAAGKTKKEKKKKKSKKKKKDKASKSAAEDAGEDDSVPDSKEAEAPAEDAAGGGDDAEENKDGAEGESKE